MEEKKIEIIDESTIEPTPAVVSAPPKREVKYRVSKEVEEMAVDKASTIARLIIQEFKKAYSPGHELTEDDIIEAFERHHAGMLVKYNEPLDELHANSHAGTYIRYAIPELLKWFNGHSEFTTIESLMADAIQRKIEEDNPTADQMAELEKLMEETDEIADKAEEMADDIDTAGSDDNDSDGGDDEDAETSGHSIEIE